jgi:tetratricopeptide (TPR) repeat protein
MKKTLFSILLVMAALSTAVTGSLAAARETTLFDQANMNAGRGDCQQAQQKYLQAAGQNGVSASLLYNLANCFAEQHKTGEAVVNYERALRLAPGDADIQANLDQVRKDAGLYRDDSPLYQQIASLLAADQWLMLAAAGFMLLAVTLLAANLTTTLQPGPVRWISIVCLLLIAATLPPALLQYQSWNDGIVTGSDARLLLSPFAEAASTGSIMAGRRVRPGKTHGNYILVEDETGRSGWLNRENIALIPDLSSLKRVPKQQDKKHHSVK